MIIKAWKGRFEKLKKPDQDLGHPGINLRSIDYYLLQGSANWRYAKSSL